MYVSLIIQIRLTVFQHATVVLSICHKLYGPDVGARYTYNKG